MTRFTRHSLRLHKFVSNSKEVLKTVAPEDRTPHLKNLDFTEDHLPIERTLGTQWCIESDSFQFRITLQDKPFTRRGILSTVSSIFDPFGFVAPLLLVGKRVLQDPAPPFTYCAVDYFGPWYIKEGRKLRLVY